MQDGPAGGLCIWDRPPWQALTCPRPLWICTSRTLHGNAICHVTNCVSHPPVSPNVTVLENRTLEHVVCSDTVTLEEGGWLIQRDWCPYRKGTLGHRDRHAQRGKIM